MENENNLPIPPAETPSRKGFVFHGETDEYFNIWAVNMLLTIATLGIYSAWAKVRTQRYFLGNTELDGARFDYTADPVSILKGRLLVAAVVGLHYLMGEIAPTASIFTAALIFFLTPWAVVSALCFRLRNTTYRGIRFDFEPEYSGAYAVYLLHGFLSAVTLGLYIPVAIARWYQFVARNARLGQTPMRTELTAGDIYEIAFSIFGPALLVIILAWAILTPIAGSLPDLLRGHDLAIAALLIFGIIGGYASFFSLMALFGIKTHKTFLNNSAFGDVSIESNISSLQQLWLEATNALAIACSLGLAYPWAKIRKSHYVLSHLHVNASTADLERFAQGVTESHRAVGEASVDLFGLGIDLG